MKNQCPSFEIAQQCFSENIQSNHVTSLKTNMFQNRIQLGFDKSTQEWRQTGIGMKQPVLNRWRQRIM